jgi:N-acetylated-alpha-linked acidic dipeptidase
LSRPYPRCAFAFLRYTTFQAITRRIPLHNLRPALLLALTTAVSAQAPQVFGYRDFTQQSKWDAAFLAVPDAALAGQHLKTLTAAPHIAGSDEDHQTALYVASKFKAAGIETQIVEYKVLLNLPKKILIEAFGPDGKKLMTGPSPEHVGPEYGGDPFQDDPRVTPAFNGASPSGDVTAEVVYANYGTPADFKKLASLGIDVKGKIVLVRYGSNYRGIKVYDAQRAGAAGVLIYSDPADDGYFRGDAYPRGPYRPASAVQRGATQFLPIYPGDATTPGIASTPDLPDFKRIPQDKIQANWPSIPVNPLSYKDAAPILEALAGPNVPHEWQGALPFAYHTGLAGEDKKASVTVHMHLEMDTRLRTIWDVIGTIPGTDPAQKDAWVVAGNHRDAWVYGAVDPNSGTAAMLETVHGLGALLKSGWKPKRTIVLGSWDAEEEGLIGSTEWVEAHSAQLTGAVAYFNTDVGVAGPNFDASAVPSLMQFVREVTQGVPSPAGGTVYDQWLKTQSVPPNRRAASADEEDEAGGSAVHAKEVRVGVLGSGSDFTPFLQHAGVPSTDIGSGGPYGVYHSVFDNYNWFIKNADPTFVYEQQQARVFGLEILHMASVDVLPYDYEAYGHSVSNYVKTAENHAKNASLQLDFTALNASAARFTAAGTTIHARQTAISGDSATLNQALRAAEEALLNPEGLPNRPWYKHTIYAPGEFTGYAAVVIPGVNEAIEAKDAPRAQTQIAALTAALNHASEILENAAK